MISYQGRTSCFTAMATDEEEEDYVFYGTPLEREEDLAPNKRKQFLDKGQAKTVPPWQQEVLDENGRQRFHGAFTGGFSAGYFNTAGSKEGWAPKSFSSSRKKRADVSQQTAYDFMDEDEKAEVDSKELAASSEFDTFGFTAAEIARHRAAQELAKRPSAIPGLPPDEIIVPVSESIGVKLLLKMGWRHGRAIGPRQMAAAPEIIREGRKAMLALAQSQEGQILEEKAHGAQMLLGSHHEPNGHEEDADIIVPSSTPVYVINPKNNLFGLGFDPYKNAPEFQERKRLRLDDATHQKTKSSKIGKRDLLSKPSLFRPNAGKMGSGFGIGALEEMDEEDEDVYAQVAEIEVAAVEEEEVQPSSPKIQHKVLLIDHKQAALPGFKRASISKCQVEWFVSPVVPPGFVAVHKFSTPLHFESALLCPAPAEMPPPEDPELRKIIDGMATFVARSGKNFEDLSREKNTANPSFQFLSGGYGYDYYKRRLWEEQRKVLEQGKEQILKPNRSKAAALDSDQRGKILGEIPLDRKSLPATPAIAPEDHARLQSALSSTFTKSTSEAVDGSSRFQLFTYDAAKQVRFEQFLKDKFQGGLRTADTITRNSLTELERAQESLEFEAASCDFEKAQVLTGAVCSAVELATLMGDRFTSESRDKAKYEEALSAVTDKYPKREEQPWRPSSLLCKRFNLLDPYAGKPPPLPKPRSRTESFILLNNPVKSTVELPLIAANQSFSVSTKVAEDPTSFEEQKVGTSSSVMDDSGIQTPVEAIVEKPVDLYKAIFSDESEDEDKKTEMELRQDKGAEAAQAALNRLEAGDFLRSLGEELGLKVPPAESAYVRKTKQSYFPKEASTDGKERIVGAQKTKKLDDWDRPFEVGSVRNSSIIHTNFPDTDAKGGENIIQAEGIGIVQQTADNMVTGSKDMMVKIDRKEEGKDSDKGKGSSKQKFSSEENSSEDEIDPHRNQRSKRESKSSKKKKRDSRRHKQKRDESHRKHLDRQKDRGKEQRHRHKHHYQHSRKHQRLSNNSSLSSTSTS